MSDAVTKKCEGCNGEIHANQILARQAGLVGGVLLCPNCIAHKREELLKQRAAQTTGHAAQKHDHHHAESTAAPTVATLGSNQGAVWFPPERQGKDVADETLTLVEDIPHRPDDQHTMIRSFSEGSTLGGQHKDSNFRRPISAPTEPATRCRTFHGKLTDAGLSHMDDIINEWLDSHPDLFIKSCTSTVGVFEGKSKEPHLLVTVFY